MKSLQNLDNIDRARLLFDLFPAEHIPALEYLENRCRTMLENADQIRKNWTANFFLTADTYLQLAAEILKGIENGKNAILKSSKKFVDVCFQYHRAIVAGTCMTEYGQQSSDIRFQLMVAVLHGNPSEYVLQSKSNS